jgi:hypothetical protein
LPDGGLVRSADLGRRIMLRDVRTTASVKLRCGVVIQAQGLLQAESVPTRACSVVAIRSRTQLPSWRVGSRGGANGAALPPLFLSLIGGC